MSTLAILRLAEQNALINATVDDDASGSDDASQEAEPKSNGRLNVSSGLYHSSKGKGDSAAKSKSKKKKQAIAAGAAILIIIAIAFAFLGSSNSLLAPALEALFTEATDTQYTSYYLRTPVLQQYMLEHQGEGNEISDKYTHVSSYLNTQLEKNNIEVSGNDLIWHHRLSDNSVEDVLVTSSNFQEMYMNDVNFRSDYLKAKHGRAATFYDEPANLAYDHLGLSRNWFSEYQQTNDSAADKANYHSTINEKFVNDTTGFQNGAGEWTVKWVRTCSDEHKDPTDDDDDEDNKFRVWHLCKGRQAKETQSRDTSDASSLLNSIQVVQAKGGISEECANLKLGNNIATSTSAITRYQAQKFFLGNIENVSKMKAGEGNNSAINEFLNFLSTSADSTVLNPTTGEAKTFSGSPLESEGMRNVLADRPMDLEQTQYFSIDRINANLAANMAYTPTSAVKCDAVGADVTKGLSSVSTEYTYGSGIATNGQIYNSIKEELGTGHWNTRTQEYTNYGANWRHPPNYFFAISDLLGSLFGIFSNSSKETEQTITGSTLSFIAPNLNQILYEDPFATSTGIAAGEYFTQGAYAANTDISRRGSAQARSSAEAVTQFAQYTNQVIALEAEVDRVNRSPFDITNKNTFLGSIAYSLLPMFTSSKLTSATSLVRSASTSLASLVRNTTYAADGVNNVGNASTNYIRYTGTSENCVRNSEQSVVSDAYCNGAMTTDMSTIDISPDDPTYKAVILDNLDGQKIRSGSNLERYIDHCVNRDSLIGSYDTNVFEALGGSTAGGDGPDDPKLHHDWHVPFMDILNRIKQIFTSDDDLSQDYERWTNGTVCNNTPDNPYWDSTIKYFQRYVEDMRILGQMDPNQEVGENPVVARTKEYYGQNPINDEADLIAHLSGITREDAETVLAVAHIYHTIDTYDASTRIAMYDGAFDIPSGEAVVAALDASTKPRFSQDNYGPDEPSTVLPTDRYLAYLDLRNRSYAIS